MLQLAGALYDNIHTKLFTLPDDTLVLPGHDYKGRCMSSIGEEKRNNPRLTKSREEFIQIMNNLNLPHPKQIARSLPANMKVGGRRLGLTCGGIVPCFFKGCGYQRGCTTSVCGFKAAPGFGK